VIYQSWAPCGQALSLLHCLVFFAICWGRTSCQGGGVHKQPKEQTTENNEKEQKVRSFFVFCVWVVVFFASLDEVGGGGIVWYNKL
jgi:hypothetical protein